MCFRVRECVEGDGTEGRDEEGGRERKGEESAMERDIVRGRTKGGEDSGSSKRVENIEMRRRSLF